MLTFLPPRAYTIYIFYKQPIRARLFLRLCKISELVTVVSLLLLGFADSSMMPVKKVD